MKPFWNQEKCFYWTWFFVLFYQEKSTRKNVSLSSINFSW